MKVFFIIGIFFLYSNLLFAQIDLLTVRGDIKEYTLSFFKPEKSKNNYKKGQKLYSDRYILNEYGEFTIKKLFPKISDYPKIIFNSKNQKTETINYYSDGTVMNRTRHFYNSQGQLVEEKFHYDSDTLILHRFFEYSGNLLSKKKEIHYFTSEDAYPDKQISTTIYTYDKNKNLVEEFYESLGHEIRYIYKYNSKNFITEFYVQDNHAEDHSTPVLKKRINYLSYDSQNWLELILEESSGQEPQIYYIQREIIYKQ
ncbi:MAG: hypothetical protein ACK4ND_18800 [Cytophagaceae bacterium]